MVTRQSDPLNLGDYNAPAIQGAQVGQARPDVAKFYRPADQVGGGGSDVLDGLLKIITPAVTQVAKAQISTDQEEAYLRGSAAAGTGMAEAEVESNPMTRDWATAGYRDTTTRLRAADAEAQTAVDMARLREQSPAEFATYLAQRRANVYEGAEGMSREARKSLLAQQLVSDRAAISLHAAKHNAYIIDLKTTSKARNVSTKFEAMDSAKGSAEAYALATGNAFTSIYGDVWLDPELPEAARIKLTTEAMQAALSRNHQGLFTMFKDEAIPMPDGTTATMFSRLPFDEQVKLTKANDASLAATVEARAQAYDTQLGLLRADLDNPNSPPMAGSDLQAFIAQGIQNNFLSRAQVAQLNEDWAKSGAKKSADPAVAAAWVSGDPQALFNMNKSDDEGARAALSQMSKAQTPLPQVTAAMMGYGLKNGSHAAFKAVGELNRAAFSTLFTGKEGNPVNAAMASTVLGQLDWAEGNGRTGAMAAFLSAFPQDTQESILEFRRQVAITRDPASAAAETATRMLANSKTLGNPGLMAALRAQNTKGDAALISNVEPRDLWGTVSSEVASFFSQSAEDRAKIGVGLKWWGNRESAEAALQSSKYALMRELEEVNSARPFASPEARHQMALAAVAARTINTDAAPVIIPHRTGQTAQSYFGVGPSVMPGTIGKALDLKYKLAQPGNQAAYLADPVSGMLQYREHNAQGVVVRNEVFDPKSLRTIIEEQDKLRGERYQASHGKGLTKTGTSGATVTFNGDNTVSGLSNDLMLEFRNNLVKSEGVMAGTYQDNSTAGVPLKAVGVGVNQRNDFYPQPGPDGKITQEQLNMSFAQASNQAAEAGFKAALDYRVGKRGFPLMAELAYQSGPGFARKDDYQPFLKAIDKKDKVAAAAEFQKTPAWAGSKDARRKHYLELINKALE